MLPEDVASFKVPTNLRGNRGRINIDAVELGEFVSIIVVKATDWDAMDSKRIKPNL